MRSWASHFVRLSSVTFVFVAAFALGSRHANAQGGVNGSIVGNVFDQTGAPVKGVKIVAKSPTQIGGAKTAYSNDEGFYRLPGLSPGKFEITASAPKLKTVVQKDIDVSIGAPSNVDVIMEVEVANVEEVKVVEKAPVVSTTSAKVSNTLDADFIDGLPTESRTHHEMMIALTTPGAYENGYRSARIRGGNANQNAFNVEGFKMNGQKVTVGSLAAMEVSTAGYGAENAEVAGGVVNMVSKSGSNKYEFQLAGFLEDSNLRLFEDASDNPEHGYWAYINPAFSGPIIKDRLWFYLNTEARREYTPREFDPNVTTLPPAPPFEYLNIRNALKLTWQVTPRNKVMTYHNANNDWHFNSSGAVYRDEREAQSHVRSIDQFHGAIWESLLTDSLFLRSQVGYGEQIDQDMPMMCRSQPDVCEHIPQVRNTFPREIYSNNRSTRTQTILRSIEVINQLEWFANNKVFGEHNLKFKSRVYSELYESKTAYNGGGYTVFNGTTPDRQRRYFSNDPRLTGVEGDGWFIRGTSGLTTVHSLQDSMRLTKYLTFTPGIAYTKAYAANVGASADLDLSAITPHVAAAWDATHDGRTVIRGSYNQYVDMDVLRLSRHVLGSQVYRECRWDAATETFTSNCTWGGGRNTNTINQPCGPTGLNQDGTPCTGALKTPTTYEYTAGAEREIIQGLGLGADAVYRLYTYPYERTETNRIWGTAGYTLNREGGYKDGKSQTYEDLSTPPGARRRYLGITASVKKREGALKMSAHYTWSALIGNVYTEDGNDFGTNPARDQYYLYGYLQDDSRHTIKFNMTYQVTQWFSTGLVWRYYSGRPISRRYRNEVEGGWNDYRAPIGINPGSNINDPGDDRPARRPDINEFNVQLRTNLKPLIGHNLEFFADVLNILALRTPTALEQNDNGSWGSPSGSRMGALKIRLNFRYRY